MAKKITRTYTVSEVNTLIGVALEEKLPSRMIVAGEISDWKHHHSGHCYFSLKDENAILPCVMWKSKFAGVKFAPEDGMAVFATGNIDVYPAGGKYQLYVDKLAPAGIGSLQLAFEQMRQRLEKEGLFSDEHKKTIPPYPMRIGLVTSESGAAVKDIAESVYSRWPCGKILLYPVPVQGAGAAEIIAAAIRQINRRNKDLKLDVLIVGRGGGAIEDLWAFNEEVVARAIFDSTIPVISAVGHEVDVTIADLVADARASTPTKAGVIAVPDIGEVTERIAVAQKRISSMVRQKLAICRGRLETVLARVIFREPYRIINMAAQRLDETATRLRASAMGLFARLWERLRQSERLIRRIEPSRLLGQKKVELNNLCNAVQGAVRDAFVKNKLQLTAVENRLAALNPKSVLNRGYSITTSKKTGKVVTAGADVCAGDVLITEVASKESIESEVKTVKGRVRKGD